MLKPSWFTEGFGWVGVIAILAAYALLIFGAYDVGDWQYHALNGIGAVGIILDAFAQKNWQPVVLNAVWLGLAAFGIVSALGLAVPKAASNVEIAAEWKNAFYTQDQKGHLSYPSEMTVLDADEQAPYHFLSTVDMALFSDRSSYHPMNYSQDGRIVVAHDLVGSEECYAVPDAVGATAFDGEAIFNDVAWKTVTFSDAAMGSRWETELYRTMREGTCYEIAVTLHFSSDWTDVDENAIQLSQNELRALLSSIISTFVFGS